MKTSELKPELTLDDVCRITRDAINSAPEIFSLLYDLDLLPEQLDKGSRDWRRMVIVTEFVKHLLDKNRTPSPEVEEARRALEQWMLVESEMKANNPCPDFALRAAYRAKAIELTKAALAKLTKETKV